MKSDSVLFKSSDIPGFRTNLVREESGARSLYAGVVVTSIIYTAVVFLFFPLSITERFLTIAASLPILVLVAVSRFLSLRDLKQFPTIVTGEAVQAGRLKIPVQSIRRATYDRIRNLVELEYTKDEGRRRVVRLLSQELGDSEKFLSVLAEVGVPAVGLKA